MTKNNAIFKSKKLNLKKIFLYLLMVTFAITFIFCIVFCFFYNTINLNTNLLSEISTPTLIFDNNDTLLNDNIQGVPYVKIDKLNDYTIKAFTSIEDKEFYNHKGLNFKRIMIAFLNNIKSGSIKEGASTISQQLIKNTHLTSDKTISRKIKEIILAIKLEKQYTKKQIMEMYLNAIYFGNGCYGIESASNFYFNKNASNLTVNESAILAGIIKSPAHYSPLTNKDNITKRKNLVLKEMYKDNVITLNDYSTNNNTPVNLNINNNSFDNQSSYINSALNEASLILNITPNQILTNKYKIYTYYDNVISNHLSNSVKHNTNAMHNAIIIDNNTNGIKAFNSSFTFGATSIRRNPASTIKPILVYGAGIEYGKIYPCSFLNDTPTTFKYNYTPKNIGNKYYGIINAQDALAKSLNIPAVSLLEEIGIEKCKSFAKKCGIAFDETDTGLSLALGAMKYGITIQELCNAYLTFVNNGKFSKSTFIKKITDNSGNEIYTHQKISKTAMSEETAYLVGKMMQNTTINGTCKSLGSLNYEIHAKTGTNGTKDENLNTDSICVAQTTKHTSCIWYFSKNNSSENLLENINTSQLSPTLKIKTLFEKLYANNYPTAFEKPKNITTLKLDAISYEYGQIELASYNTPTRYILEFEFNKKYTPTKVSTHFTSIIKPEINYKKEIDCIIITYKTLKHQKYELIKEFELNGKIIEKLLQVVNGKTGLIEYKDCDINQTLNYKYYIKVSLDTLNDYELSNILDINITKQKSIIKNGNLENYNYYNYFN